MAVLAVMRRTAVEVKSFFCAGRPEGPDGTHLSGRSSQLVVSEFAKHDTGAPEERNTLSIPWVVCAAILCGVGVFLLTGALIRFAGGIVDTTWWIGIAPAVIGFLMLANPRAGSQGPH